MALCVCTVWLNACSLFDRVFVFYSIQTTGAVRCYSTSVDIPSLTIEAAVVDRYRYGISIETASGVKEIQWHKCIYFHNCGNYKFKLFSDLKYSIDNKRAFVSLIIYAIFGRCNVRYYESKSILRHVLIITYGHINHLIFLQNTLVWTVRCSSTWACLIYLWNDINLYKLIRGSSMCKDG